MSALDAGHVVAVTQREVKTVTRNRGALVLFAGLAALLVGFTWAGGGHVSGYAPTVVDLLTPVELLVPVVAFALGYRVFVADRERGELAVHETLPPSRASIVAGTFLGRGLVLALGVAVAALPSLLFVVVSDDGTSAIYAAQRGADSPLLFARFVAVATLLGLVALAGALAVSAIARSTRSAVGLALGLWAILAVGADVGALAALQRGLLEAGGLPTAVVVGPGGAYRGLVFATVLDAATAATASAVEPAVGLLSLLAWTTLGLVAAAVALW
ncbi:ABC transporter permease [Halobellus sp. Atlit-31R]|nr:ABC transporter permease [Halobellus sp. Atlit-31R]